MKGDFSRITYNGRKHYSLVLMQQGRVQLDADWNDQALIHWFNLQNLAEDLIGEHGGPGDSFKIEQRTIDKNAVPRDFVIKKGRYYVHGAMCQNNADRPFSDQEDYFPADGDGKIKNGNKYLVYLYLWWRHITAEEDDGIREVALGGPDTATRIRAVWQVKVTDVTNTSIPDLKKEYVKFVELLKEKDLIKRGTGVLQAQAKTSSEPDEPCITTPANSYRGAENQLYRVEIHRSGKACNGYENGCATFKWSRENGSVVFPIRELGESSVTLEHLGRDHRFGLKAGDWVEVVDGIYELQRRAENLLKVTLVDPDTMEVTLSGTPQLGRNLSEDPQKRPLLRRWDHPGDVAHEGTVPVTQDEWLELEDGVQIKFTKPQPDDADYWYQSSDWWWIPARKATGDVEWPRDDDNEPTAQEALNHGDHYAPLALIEINDKGVVTFPKDYRRVLKQLW
jgi:hypothetical protein